MHPILIDLGPFQIPTYGVLLATAFLLALRLSLTLARREGIEPERMTSLWIWILLAGLVGAKAMLYAVDWRYYAQNPSAILSTWRSAGVYYGGFLGAAAAGIAYARRHRLPLGRLADLIAPSLALGQSVGRVGCFAAGCCYGRAARIPWAVTFTDPHAHQFTGVPLNEPLHPTQIYLSLNALALCGLLLWIFRLARRRDWPHGIVFWSYVLAYGGTRFAFEFLRNDPRGQIGPFATSQALSLVAIAVSGAALAVLLGRRRRRA